MNEMRHFMRTYIVSPHSRAASGNLAASCSQLFSQHLRRLGALLLALTSFTLPSWQVSAQMVWTRLHSFGMPESSGGSPVGALVQGRDGAFYGTTTKGGSGGRGTVFKLNPDGTDYTVLYHFTLSDYGPASGLIQGSDGAFYGMTARDSWGRDGGSVYKLNLDGTGFTILHRFRGSGYDNGGTLARLVQGTDGVLYGTTYDGGRSGAGSAFKLNLDGTGYTVLHHFTPWNGGAHHPMGGLLEGADGALYGTTLAGGDNDGGTVFKLNRDGTGYAVLHHFAARDDGYAPKSGLLEGPDGVLFGTTKRSADPSYGTVFRIHSSGRGHAILHAFAGESYDGRSPAGGLVRGADGALYGTTRSGGRNDSGTVFQLNPDGTGYTILHDFDQSDGGGFWPEDDLVQGTDGAFYGTTTRGGDMDLGTIFRIEANRVPSLLCASLAVLPCSPPGGFSVTVPVEVSDLDGQALAVSWDVDGTTFSVEGGSPPTTATVTFTSVFTPGTHTITFTASDGFTNASCQTTITVEADTTPPTLVRPANVRVEFVNETGARAEFPVPMATDDCSGSAPVSCVPASGSVFPIGTTLVVCTATDEAGNRAECTFTVTVLGARGLKEAMLAELRVLKARGGRRDALQLAEAIEALQRSLAAWLWVDETHLTPHGGDLMLSAEKEAMQKLRTLLQNEQGQLGEARLTKVILRLAKGDRLLAVVALQEAGNGNAGPSRLEAAWRQVTQGDQAMAQGEYVAGIEHYRNAWTRALDTKR
jgi:uncharacterized repeat protein (TIGR03803 family)